MISIEELKHLIETEKRIIPGQDHDTYLRYDFFEPNEEIEKQRIKENGTNYASCFLLESYCWRTFEFVNEHLRSTCGIPTNEFVKEYKTLLNKLLDGIESYDDQITWRWVNCFKGFEYLKTQVGKTVEIPEFKSTSKRKLENRIYWRIKTDINSNGKMIFKHIDKYKARSEQEILFKSNSIFKIENADENCLYLEEIKNDKIDFILSENYWEN